MSGGLRVSVLSGHFDAISVRSGLLLGQLGLTAILPGFSANFIGQLTRPQLPRFLGVRYMLRRSATHFARLGFSILVLAAAGGCNAERKSEPVAATPAANETTAAKPAADSRAAV